MLHRITLALLFAATAAWTQQQSPQYGEKVDVNLVLLDAVVTDSRGNQILGLDKNDFVVKENGVPQEIDSVDYFSNKPVDTGVFFNRLALARNAVKDFIRKDMKPTDVAAVVAHDVRLKVYSDFTSDRQQLERAGDETALFGRGITTSDSDPNAPSILRGGTSKIIDDTGTVYEALQLIGERLRGIRARKE